MLFFRADSEQQVDMLFVVVRRMGRIKYTKEQIGQVRTLLDLNWSAAAITRWFKGRGVPISASYVRQINRQMKNPPSPPPSETRGRKPKLSPMQIRSLTSNLEKEDPPTQKEMAKKYDVHDRTIRRNIKKLGRKIVVKPKVHAITENTKEIRRIRSWPLYIRLRKNRWMKVITSDEAWFYITGKQCQRSIQYISREKRRKDAATRSHVQHPVGVMVWVAFSTDGFFEVHFVDPKVKINRHYYIKKVLTPFAGEYMKRYPNRNVLFHQDSAPSHKAKDTVAFLRKCKIPFIKPWEWMSNSPDCSPCDFWLFGYLKSRLSKRNIMTIQGLKNAIREEVKNIPRDMIERALKSWPRRCRYVYYNKGGTIENFK